MNVCFNFPFNSFYLRNFCSFHYSSYFQMGPIIKHIFTYFSIYSLTFVPNIFQCHFTKWYVNKLLTKGRKVKLLLFGSVVLRSYLYKIPICIKLSFLKIFLTQKILVF